jgi:hypothetical protein
LVEYGGLELIVRERFLWETEAVAVFSPAMGGEEVGWVDELAAERFVVNGFWGGSREEGMRSEVGSEVE